jgi:hypothetical protein
MLLIGPQLRRSQLRRRLAEVFAELHDTQDVGLDGSGRLVAQTQIVDVTPPQRTDRFPLETKHGATPR